MIGVVAGVLFLVDQCLKWIAANYWLKPFWITAWFSLRYEQNFGIAWSIPIPYVFLIFLNICLFFVIPFFLMRQLDLQQKIAQVLMGFLLAGAMGNIFDRLYHGYVIDYISIGFWPVFNLADALLSLSIFLIIVFYGRIRRV